MPQDDSDGRGIAVTPRRILIVNCYFDDARQNLPRPTKIPKAMGPAFLAGAFHPRNCDVRLYCEMHSGALEDPDLLGWPDMVVLTGLTLAFDRMLHITAYARSRNPRVIVVAGGPAIRSFPQYASQFFDYCCQGEPEELMDVAREALGQEYVAEEMTPRLDLAYWMGRVACLESSRYCNFRCSFCSLTAENGRYWKYSLEQVRRQLEFMRPNQIVQFIDNNFYGNDRQFFLARVNMLREMWRARRFKAWSAIVTNDFFLNDDNLQGVREAGCIALFSGVESFDCEWLDGVNKVQNTRVHPSELIRKCLDAGIIFLYGLMLDPTRRTVADLRQEMDYVTGNSEITLPAFITVPVALPGTPYFHECAERQMFLPKTRVRDLEGTTLSLRPREDIDVVAPLVGQMQTLEGYGWRIARQCAGFYRTYRRVLSPMQLGIGLGSNLLLCAYGLATAPRSLMHGISHGRDRTYVSTTERLDPVYRPRFRVESEYESYFQPTMLTDNAGHLTAALAPDLARAARLRG